MFSKENFHSVKLDKDKCKGCTNCIKNCPTEAIRVRNGKAYIINDRCIDCGECIRVCPYHAKKAIVDNFSKINDFKFKIALPAPSFYAQFKKNQDVDYILTALKKIGFDDVFEVSKAADVITKATKVLIESGQVKEPVISSACPAIVKLIRVRFPNLIDNILPLIAPMELASYLARKNAVEKYGYKPEEVGTFFISPCPAKATVVKSIVDKNYRVDGVLPMNEVYIKVLNVLGDIKEKEITSSSTVYGINWGKSGGESAALCAPSKNTRYLSVDGINNVINILEQLEDEQLKDVDFVEGNACVNGCIGGALTVENSFLSRIYLNRVTENASKVKDEVLVDLDVVINKDKYEHIPIYKLSDDLSKAMSMMDEMEKIINMLPGIDCGSCGAPSCRALAEDIIRDKASIDDCVFKMRERVRSLVTEMVELQNHMPPPLRTENKE